MNRWTITSIFFGFVFISHVLLPVFNNSNDFLIFSPWNVFSSSSQQKVFDLSWDGGKTYFFRDYPKKGRAAGINMVTLFYLVNMKDLTRIRKDYLTKIHEFCHCDSIDFLELSGSLYNHIVLKNDNDVLSRQKL